MQGREAPDSTIRGPARSGFGKFSSELSLTDMNGGWTWGMKWGGTSDIHGDTAPPQPPSALQSRRAKATYIFAGFPRRALWSARTNRTLITKQKETEKAYPQAPAPTNDASQILLKQIKTQKVALSIVSVLCCVPQIMCSAGKSLMSHIQTPPHCWLTTFKVPEFAYSAAGHRADAQP